MAMNMVVFLPAFWNFYPNGKEWVYALVSVLLFFNICKHLC